jgi:hypothetical protein
MKKLVGMDDFDGFVARTFLPQAKMYKGDASTGEFAS